jgi:hypothetical protein
VLANAIDVESNGRVGVHVNTRELDRWTGRTITRAGDLDLRAAVVELCLANMSTVKGNVFRSDEILSRRGTSGDLERDAVVAPGAPVRILQTVRSASADGLLVDLEPVARAIVLAGRAGGLGHVDLNRTGMLHRGSVGELEADGVAGSDRSCFGSFSGGESALVAAEIVVEGRDGGRVDELGRHVLLLAGVLADVLPASRDLAVEDEFVEDVVGRDRWGQGQDGGGSNVELHDESAFLEVLSGD